MRHPDASVRGWVGGHGRELVQGITAVEVLRKRHPDVERRATSSSPHAGRSGSDRAASSARSARDVNRALNPPVRTNSNTCWLMWISRPVEFDQEVGRRARTSALRVCGRRSRRAPDCCSPARRPPHATSACQGLRRSRRSGGSSGAPARSEAHAPPRRASPDANSALTVSPQAPRCADRNGRRLAKSMQRAG
jgi:hypothetical protein